MRGVLRRRALASAEYGSGGHKSLPTAAAPPTWGEAQQGDNLFDPRNRRLDRSAPMTCFDLHTQAAAEIVQTVPASASGNSHHK